MGNLFTSSKPKDRETKKDADRSQHNEQQQQQQQQQQKEEKEELPPLEVELLILGDGGVGKSLWREKYVADSVGFGDPKYGENDKEIDVMVQEYRCKGRDLLLNIRDTQGQEKEGEVAKEKYEGLHGVFLLYDVTNQDTLDHIEIWLEKCREVVPDVKVVLVGNKFEEKKRTITFQDGQATAERLNVPFFETSGRAGIMVDQAIRSMVLTLAEEYEEKGI